MQITTRPARAQGLVAPAISLAILATAASPLAAQDAAQRAARPQTQRLDVFASGDRVAALSSTTPAGALLDQRERPIRTPEVALAELASLFGVTDADAQLHRIQSTIDNIGHSRAVYRQVHNGVPVFAGGLNIHRNDIGHVIAMNGDVFKISADLDTTPTVTPDAARMIARERALMPHAVIQRLDLVVVDPGWYGDRPLGARLAYHAEVDDPATSLREALFIDAHTGAVLDSWSMVHTIQDAQVHDAEGGTALPGTIARSAAMPDATGIPEIDAGFDYANDTYRYFNNGFGRDGIDGAGSPIVVSVNVGFGSCPNAFWNGSQTVFCDGLVTDDVVGHEIAHGITQFTAGLIYQNQPGQLNESFSDVFGEMVDLFNGDGAMFDAGTPWPASGTGPGLDLPNDLRSACSPSDESNPDGVRWLIGEDVVPFGGAIRDMWDPTCRSHPDRANSPLQRCRLSDVGGVHRGSGVPNHAFAILTDGDDFNGVNVTGIGAIKSGAVWYRALATYLGRTSDFHDAYWAFNQAALDLVGTFPNDPRTGAPSTDMFTSADAQQVDLALRAVEMDSAGSCGDYPDVLDPSSPPDCGPTINIYEDDFETGAPGWTMANAAATAYDWALTAGTLPLAEPGVAMHCPNLPTSPTSDESGTHDLISPPITIPGTTNTPVLSFRHLMRSELHWDGGTLAIKSGANPWTTVPASAFFFNQYTEFLASGVDGNTNPDASAPAFTGSGGQWGTSMLNLSPYVSPADTFQVRFRFSKDRNNGADGWYIADVRVFDCIEATDCDADLRPDVTETNAGAAETLALRIPTGSNGWFSDADPQDEGQIDYAAQRTDVVRPITLEQIRVWGGHYPDNNQPIPIFSVFIHEPDPANDNLPGTVVFSQDNVAASQVSMNVVRFGIELFEFTLDLAAPPTLTDGMYWIQVRDNSAGDTDTFLWVTSWIDSGLENIAEAESEDDLAWTVGSSTYSLSLELIGTDNAVGGLPCEFDGAAPVGVLDLLVFLADWFPLTGSEVPAGTPVDYDRSLRVDVSDLLGFLACWFPASETGCP